MSAAIAGWYRRWRLEARLTRAAQDLGRLDTHMLRDIGIVDRSGIDWVVRHGRDRRGSQGD